MQPPALCPLTHHVWPVEALAHAVQVVGARATYNEVVRRDRRADEVEGGDEGLVVLLQPGHDRLDEIRTKPTRNKKQDIDN